MSPDAYKVLDIAEELDRAERAGRAGGSSVRPADLTAVADQIEPAVEYLIDNDRAAAMRLVGVLAGYWQDAGLVNEGRALTEKALQGGHRLAGRDPQVAAAIPRALLTASELAFRQRDQAAARKLALDAVRAAILVEDRPTAAMAHNNLARVAYRNGDAGEIERHARQALALAGSDTLARRGALHMLAWAAHTAGDLDEAQRRFEKSLEYRRKVAGPVSVAVETSNLADIWIERGDLARGAALHAEALHLSHKAGSVYLLVNNLPSIAVLAAGGGLDEAAVQLFGAADALAAASGLTPDPNSSADKVRDKVRRRLGEAEFARQLATGAALETDAALALARDVAAQLAAG